jgi:DNA mismatch endonuclease (patch repair protein)
MADVFSKADRSRIMRRVKSHGNQSTELRLIRFFRANALKGWRRNAKVFGRPDFVFPKDRIAVFVDGCFWHGHECRNLRPSTNKDYWARKIAKNRLRDLKVTLSLTTSGWNVIRLWECQLKSLTLLSWKKLARKRTWCEP